MSVSPVCPRCGEELVVRPGSAAQAWCHVHGAVTPLHHTVLVAHDAISAVTADARVPAWVPDPRPAGWSVTGLAWGGEPGARAIVVDTAGPAPLGGSAELVLVAEEPGTGVGCGYAGLPGLDPGDVIEGPSSVDVKAAGQRAPLWAVPTSDDRAAFGTRGGPIGGGPAAGAPAGPSFPHGRKQPAAPGRTLAPPARITRARP